MKVFRLFPLGCPLTIVLLFLILVGCAPLGERRDQSLDFARMHSGTQSQRDWNDKYWDAVAQFYSYYEYLAAAKIFRATADSTITDAEVWFWDFEDNRLVFREKRSSLN
jgi:hypothetical protein